MTRAFSFVTLVLAAALLGAGATRAQSPSQPRVKQPPSSVKTAAPAEAKKPAKPQAQVRSEEQSKPRLTADQAYKANCTRCHSELPKLDARAMKTVLMHMRVRANMPEDEAREILKYLTR